MIDQEKMKVVVEQFEKCSSTFIALGDKVRQKLLLDIVDAGFEGINVQNLAAKTKLSRPAVSHHLKILKDTGLIVPLKKGTQIFYRISVIAKLREIQKLGLLIEDVVAGLDESEKKIFFTEV